MFRSTTDRKSTRLNSSHLGISYAVFWLKKTISLPSPIVPASQVGSCERAEKHTFALRAAVRVSRNTSVEHNPRRPIQRDHFFFLKHGEPPQPQPSPQPGRLPA